MTDAPAIPAVRLWTPDGFRADEWVHAEDAALSGSNARLILPLAAWSSLDAAARFAARDRLGVLLQPGEAIDAIVPHLDELALVALAFPAFSDGRSFSKAQLLRGRHGYRGPLRAVGQILVDQLPHMLRLGFDQFEVTHPVLIARLEKGQVGGLPLHYQPAIGAEAKAGGYSWRRRPAV